LFKVAQLGVAGLGFEPRQSGSSLSPAPRPASLQRHWAGRVCRGEPDAGSRRGAYQEPLWRGPGGRYEHLPWLRAGRPRCAVRSPPREPQAGAGGRGCSAACLWMADASPPTLRRTRALLADSCAPTIRVPERVDPGFPPPAFTLFLVPRGISLLKMKDDQTSWWHLFSIGI